MERWERAHSIVRQWHRQGIAAGVYLSDVPYEDLAPEEQHRMYREAFELARKAMLVPIRRKGKWVWVEYRYRY